MNPNKTGWQTATGTNAWQFEMPLITGTNSISACAVDAAGNRSSTNTVSLINVAAVELPVALDGKGGVTPVYTGQLLEIGRRYTLTAKPNAGHLFAGWSGGTNASAAALTFTMRAGLQLTASFTSNYFPSLKGAYNGLFLAGDAASVTASNSGFFSLTLGSTGSFTGRLLLAGATRNFSAAFNPRNKASFQIAAGSGRPALQMQLELAPASATVTGVVAGATWTASVDSVRAYAGAADPYAGRYTKVLAGGADAGERPVRLWSVDSGGQSQRSNPMPGHHGGWLGGEPECHHWGAGRLAVLRIAEWRTRRGARLV